MQSIESLIVGHPFWQGLPPEFLPLVAQSGTLQPFGVGDLIFQERQNADHLYLLHHGKVALETFVPGRGVVTLQVLGPGEALGWSWLFPPYCWQYSARSVDATEIVAFSAASLRQQAEKDPAFGRDLVTRMAQVLLQRLQATRQKLQEFNDPGVGQRIDECLGDVEVDENTERYRDTPS